MYIDKDAKIMTLYLSITALFVFIIFYVQGFEGISSNDNFELLQIIIFSVTSILALIFVISMLSLIKDKKLREIHLENIRKNPELKGDIAKEKVKIPYNKWGLVSLIISSTIGVILFLYFYTTLASAPSSVHIAKENMELVMKMIFVFIAILMIILLVSVFSLIKKVQNPVFYEYKPCPVCGNKDIFKVEYSFIGGLLSSAFHIARCKKCGKTYNGVTGENLRRYYTVIMIILIVVIILQLIRFIV